MNARTDLHPIKRQYPLTNLIVFRSLVCLSEICTENLVVDLSTSCIGFISWITPLAGLSMASTLVLHWLSPNYFTLCQPPFYVILRKANIYPERPVVWNQTFIHWWWLNCWHCHTAEFNVVWYGVDFCVHHRSTHTLHYDLSIDGAVTAVTVSTHRKWKQSRKLGLSGKDTIIFKCSSYKKW